MLKYFLDTPIRVMLAQWPVRSPAEVAPQIGMSLNRVARRPNVVQLERPSAGMLQVAILPFGTTKKEIL